MFCTENGVRTNKNGLEVVKNISVSILCRIKLEDIVVNFFIENNKLYCAY